MNRLGFGVLMLMVLIGSAPIVTQGANSLEAVERNAELPYRFFVTGDGFSALADEARVQSFVEAVINLNTKAYEPEQVQSFFAAFSGVEGLLGNTQTFVVVLSEGEDLADIARQSSCQISVEACDLESVTDQIASIGVIGDDGERYKFIKITSGAIQTQIIFLDHEDLWPNERSQSAISAYVNEFVEQAVGTQAGFPQWWIRGQQEYLYQRLSSSMNLGLFLGNFHNQISDDLQARVSNGAPMLLQDADYSQIFTAAIIKLVHDFSLKSVFIDIYRYDRDVDWGIRFEEVFDTSPDSFSEELRQELVTGVNLNDLRDPNDLLDSLEAAWESDFFEARSLISAAPFEQVMSVDFTKTDGCPHMILMESHEFGDFNGDGYEDIVITLDENNSWAQSAGIFCAAPTSVISILGAAPGARPEAILVDREALGARDTAVADINNDGFDDLLVVGAHHKNSDTFAEDSPSISSVNLYFGGPAGLKKATTDLRNSTLYDLGDMTSEFATFGDIDGDSRAEFFMIGTRSGVSFPQPLVIDCAETCSLNHPVGFDADTYPSGAWGISVYNGALIDLDDDGDLDILMNLEVDPNNFDQEFFLDERYGHAAYYQAEGRFDMDSYPKQVPMGFRLDQNKVEAVPDDDRVLPLNATHYWESEISDLDGDGMLEFLTLENNQFHVTNATFLISIYERDQSGNYVLSSSQPQNTGGTHDQNINLVDLDGDQTLDILSTLKPNSWYNSATIALHKYSDLSWQLSEKSFNEFMQENNCNRIYTPDLNADGNFDIVIACPRADQLEIYFSPNKLAADADKDGIPDVQDRYPQIKIGLLIDTDGDGAPDDCNPVCLATGMAADSDDDNDDVSDVYDAFPLDASESVDTDGDGIGNNADEDDDNDGYSDEYELETGTDPLDPADFKPPYDDLNGIVYHWSKHSVMSDVAIARELNGIEATATSNDAGKYLFIDSDEANYQLSANKALMERDTDRTITSADALAALKIAVGLNPNSDPDGDGPLAPLPVSPFQLIAADMNQDGRVTSGDALAILKIAVGLSDALSPVWALVEDSQPIWTSNNDKSSVFDAKTPYALNYPNQTQANFAAILVGDVNSSWSPESGFEILNDEHFSSHALTFNAPLSLWGIRDTDGDGLSDAQEEALGTAIDDADTDDDGSNDALDAFPLDPERSEDAPTGMSIPKAMGESPLKSIQPVTLHPPVLLRGDMNDWGTELVFEESEDGSYILQTTIDAGTYTFKIASDNWAVMDLGAIGESERLVELGAPVDLAENASTPFIIELNGTVQLTFEITIDKQLIVTESIQSEKTP
ncbi:MAG: FG-GAP-like repeat-containing protein [Halieaceae bacterium]|nr:FG-GAP-like repeat-containing protein [Halieaceae bacterium]